MLKQVLQKKTPPTRQRPSPVRTGKTVLPGSQERKKSVPEVSNEL